MKIGILTFHRCINYGSYWQTRCLADEIRRKGHTVSILDHRSGRIDIAEWKCALQPVLPTPVQESDHRLYRKKIEKFISAIERLPLSRPFPLDKPWEMEEFDIVVVGSDEVWNLSHPWYGDSPLFFGEGIRSERLIAYAASCGNYNGSGIEMVWSGQLKKFDRISVRDRNSWSIIRKATGTDPEIVLDPCLAFQVSTDKPDLFISTEPFAAVYGHNFSSSFINQARRWAKERRIPLVSIGYRNDWADEQWLTAGPLEFSSFIRRSVAVLTNFFHGCVFSLVFSRPFVCETTQYRNIKISDLIARTGGERHLINSETSFNSFISILTQPISEDIMEKIRKLKTVSSDFLNNSIMPGSADDLNEKILQSEKLN